MQVFAHRGIIDYENTITGVLEVFNSSSLTGVEIDVSYNKDNELVLCHSSEHVNDAKNDKFQELLFVLSQNEYCNKDLMIDIKVACRAKSEQIAKDICHMIASYPKLLVALNFYLASFNEYCVSALSYYIEDLELTHCYVGVITSGIPIGFFNHIQSIDFVSIDYNILCKENVENFKKQSIKVYAWVVNDFEVKKVMCEYDIDGIVMDIKSSNYV